MKTRLLLVLMVLVIVGLVMTHDPPARHAKAQSGGDTGIPLVNGWNITSVTSNSTVLASNFTPKTAASVLRIGVVLGSAAPLSIRESDGTTTFTSYLNGGTALTAGCMYTFVWECRCRTAPGGVTGPSLFNFVVSSPTTVPILRVTEVTGPVD